jgi:hypothetical protein
MRRRFFRPLALTILIGANATACASAGGIGPSVRTVSAAQRDRDCTRLGVVVGTEHRALEARRVNESAMTQVRHKVRAAGGNALYVISNRITAEVRTITAEALKCRFGART